MDMKLSYDNQGEFSKKLFIETYGCQMNVADSEVVASVMKMAGYDTTDTLDAADAIFINTCSIRDNAEQKIFSRLNQLNALRRNRKRRLIVGIIGCMAERLKEVLINEYDVDIVAGPDSYLELPNLIASAEAGEKAIETTLSTTETYRDIIPQRISGNKVSGYISIMRGCNNFCTYCIVPYVRGREKSREPQAIIREIERLVADGVTEIMLLGQNVNSYGKTLETPVTFAELLKEVEKIEGLKRIRFMTSHPKDLSDELIQTMAESKKICHHLHLPLQSGSSRVLKEMNRRYDKEKYLQLVDKIREAIPDISLTTDIMVGFPGETEEDFQETLDVVRKANYDTAFTFIYSKRSGTPAAGMENQVPEEQVKKDFDRLLKVVQDTARERVARLEGQTLEALVEEVNEQDASLLTGRLSNNTIVHFKGDPGLIGKIVPVYLKECHGFYYLGELMNSRLR